MKIEKNRHLLLLDGLLQSDGPITAEQLAFLSDSSTRTVKQDIPLLSSQMEKEKIAVIRALKAKGYVIEVLDPEKFALFAEEVAVMQRLYYKYPIETMERRMYIIQSFLSQDLVSLEELEEKLADKEAEINNMDQELKLLQEQLALAKEEDELQTYGLYEPHYDFENATAYKEKLDELRKQQKQLIKDKKAAWAKPNMTLNGDARKGQALMNDNVKQIIRTFNTECDGIIRKVKHSNIEASEKRIRKSYETLNKLNERLGVRIEQRYLDLKIEELYLAYEYEVKKQEEKEMLAEAREREREEKKLRKKLEKEKNKFNRENDRINNELTDAEAKLQAANDEEKARLEAEIAELKAALEKNNDEIEKIDKWEETPGAGYVYIISNIGSFGEDVFKIGVTRRDDPEERIRELSNHQER